MPTYIQVLDTITRSMADFLPSVPTYFRMLEVLACSMADYLPYILLVVYPFRTRTWLKGFPAGLLTLVMTPVVLYYDISCALRGAAPPSISFPLMRSTALLVLALLVIREHPGRFLLNACSIVNLSILISTLADRFAGDYTAKHLLVTLLLQALLLIPYTLSIDRIVMPALDSSESMVWKLLFLVPAAGTIAGCLMLKGSAAALPAVMIAALILTAAAVAAAYYLTRREMRTLILKKAKSAKQQVSPVIPVSSPDPAEAYFSALQKRMLEAELSYHEVLAQIMTMEDDLNNENLAQLREKLTVLKNQLLPQITSTGNAHIDPVLTYFTRRALLSNVKIAMNVTLLDVSSVSDEDLTVLLGCLLDYALENCREQTSGTRRIAAASHLDDDLLQIGIKHTYASAADQTCDLLETCRSIAARYDGSVNVIDMNGASQIVVTLHI